MDQPVSIKGVRSGIVLKLDGEKDFKELKPIIAERFQNAASFFGESSIVLSIEGRDSSDEEIDEILKIIEENTRLDIVALAFKDEEQEKKFEEILKKHAVSADEKKKKQKDRTEDAIRAIEEFRRLDRRGAEIHVGTLRSGASYNTEYSLVILGDVKRGAEVTAGSSIFVLGSMLGTAGAGALGDPEAFVWAMHLDPLQIRIADRIAISEDQQDMIPSHSSVLMETGPEVAVISDGHIVIKRYDWTFLETCSFLMDKPIKHQRWDEKEGKYKDIDEERKNSKKDKDIDADTSKEVSDKPDSDSGAKRKQMDP